MQYCDRHTESADKSDCMTYSNSRQAQKCMKKLLSHLPPLPIPKSFIFNHHLVCLKIMTPNFRLASYWVGGWVGEGVWALTSVHQMGHTIPFHQTTWHMTHWTLGPQKENKYGDAHKKREGATKFKCPKHSVVYWSNFSTHHTTLHF
jgi:hypothetical protein